MISDLLNRHPAVLSLSEFLVLLGQEAFARRHPTGAQFWRMLAHQSPALRATIRDVGVMEEVLYPSARRAPASRPPTCRRSPW